MTSETTKWPLRKYAIFQPCNVENQGDTSGVWKHFENIENNLFIKVDKNIFWVHKNAEVMEKYNLHKSRNVLRGFAREDRMIMIYQNTDETRRFRMRFADAGNSAAENCLQCARLLQKYIVIDLQSSNANQKKEKKNSIQKKTSKKINPNIIDFSVAYTNITTIIDDRKLDEIINSCLDDPTFPEFVKRVDKHLQKLNSS